ncbi:hypothetical protein SYNPS1DRAFT_32016 [Syncephalis pseudoplumigaleata]|uniref:Major facilitator superfamily (MFS) profile domain-containing protein n=1 Tax=Syncephalis pseudoplumigaleata TaxID=1712513 RepID=A0A4P9YRT4_9FUNG|nr:hypothetical protein SYNPS1DRAFT_32016 [Syncephalis pseudoplumigaleata]|eukprot:RKP22395.1 hypothetical protein SYNPS1DRAFT_32016 [Syncephalis pseudoplumigaleata]
MWSRVLQAMHADTASEPPERVEAVEDETATTSTSSEANDSTSRSDMTIYMSADEMSTADGAVARDSHSADTHATSGLDEIVEVATRAYYPGTLSLPALALEASSMPKNEHIPPRRVTFSPGPPPIHAVRRISELEKCGDGNSHGDDWMGEDAFYDWDACKRQQRSSSLPHPNTSVVVHNWRHAVVLVGWLVALLAVTMDSLAVAMITPIIVSTYKSSDKLIWLICPYLLAHAIGQPIAQQLALHSSQARRCLALLAGVLFVASTAGTIFAATFGMLVLARTATGLAAGTIACLARDAMQGRLPLLVHRPATL